ncbi:hypothetical protein ACLOJK_013293 [Asimina triloba]
MKEETITLILVNLAGIMERADEALLPGVYKEVGAALHTDPTGLGSLTLFRSIVQSSCYPLAAYLGIHYNRAHVIALGAFLWAAATFLVGISSTFFQDYLIRVNLCSRGSDPCCFVSEDIPFLEQWSDLCCTRLVVGCLIQAFNETFEVCILEWFWDLTILANMSEQASVDIVREAIPIWLLQFLNSAVLKTHHVAVSRALNGIGLAIVTPAIQSIVADLTDDSNRGIAFGWLQLTGNFGSILGGLFSVLLASTSFMGIPGWRIAFHLVAIVSIVVGVFVRFFANDPHFANDSGKNSDPAPRKSFWLEVKDMAQEAKSVIKIPSFQIIMAQGVTGSFPWSALSFAPMWLELIGFSHKQTAFLMGLFVIASSLGGLFGGKMGDLLSRRYPNAGRIVLSQISSGSAIPLAALLLLVLPDDPSTGFIHGLVLFIVGFCISWNAPATNNPIFAEIVPERSRTSIYALDRSVESVLSSFAPPVVGLLSQHIYGYKPVPQGSSGNVEAEIDRENAASLAKALYTAIGFPIALCCFIYSFLYCTYPRDRERAQMDSLIESEMQQIELDNPPAGGEHARVQFSEADGLYDKERVVTEMEFGDDSSELDNSDEKSLLTHQLTFSDLAH